METSGTPYGGGDSAPPPVQQTTTVVQVGGHKSVGGAVALAFLFGPLGMLYATVPGAVVMFFITVPVAIVTFGLGLLVTIPICMVWAGVAASSHNQRLQAVSTQHIATAAPPPPQAAPSPPTPSPTPPPAAAPPAAVTAGPVAAEGEPEVILKSARRPRATCAACGHAIDSQARFCSACGEAHALP